MFTALFQHTNNSLPKHSGKRVSIHKTKTVWSEFPDYYVNKNYRTHLKINQMETDLYNVFNLFSNPVCYSFYICYMQCTIILFRIFFYILNQCFVRLRFISNSTTVIAKIRELPWSLFYDIPFYVTMDDEK